MKRVIYYGHSKMKDMLKKLQLALSKVLKRGMECRQSGDSYVISVVLMIVIVLGFILAFRDQITSIVTILFGNVNNFVGDL